MNKRIKKLIDKRCYICDDPRGHLLDVHRIIPGSQGGKYTHANTVTLCVSHHRSIHSDSPTLVIHGWRMSTRGRVLHYIEDGEEKFK